MVLLAEQRFFWKRLGELKDKTQSGKKDIRTWALYKYGTCLATITFTEIVPKEERVPGGPVYLALSIRIVPHLGYKEETYTVRARMNDKGEGRPVSPDYRIWKRWALERVTKIIDNRKGETKEDFNRLGWDVLLHGKLPIIR